jgi:hypothetical protein
VSLEVDTIRSDAVAHKNVILDIMDVRLKFVCPESSLDARVTLGRFWEDRIDANSLRPRSECIIQDRPDSLASVLQRVVKMTRDSGKKLCSHVDWELNMCD